MLSVTMLGTSSGVPTKERNVASIFLLYKDQRILFDCGEGTQRQLMSDNLKFMRINRIFISHWHADHFAGLIGLVQTMSLEGRDEPLHVYGPKETKRFVNQLLSVGYFEHSFDLNVHELSDGEEVDCGEFTVTAFDVDHRIPALGFVFEEKAKIRADMKKAAKLGLETSPLIGKLKAGKTIEYKGKKIAPEDILYTEKGKKVVYTGDTRFCQNLLKFSDHADLLIADSTFATEFAKKAHNVKHMTSAQAAKVAKGAHVKKLVLTHFSRRYQEKDAPRTTEDLLKEAKEVFPNTVLAKDFLEIDVD